MKPSRYLAALTGLTLAATGLAAASGAFASSGPTVSPPTVSAVGNDAATVSVSVNPAGQATTVAFEYGTSVHYTQQTAVQDVASGTQPATVSERLAALRPGTTYHVRAVASNAGGTTAGPDTTFTTTGIAVPSAGQPQVATGAATAVTVDGANLTGVVNTAGVPAGETVHVYFQLGPKQPYALQTLAQTVTATGTSSPVSAQVSGLESAQLFHYRLEAVTDSGQVVAGADETFATLPKERLQPTAVQSTATPSVQRQLPDRVTVSGKVIPPPSMSDFLACRGYFDITFRVGQVAVQSLRAGIHPDCSFSLPVVFHNRRRLMGGRVTVHVLFAGNRFLHRLEAPPITIQVG